MVLNIRKAFRPALKPGLHRLQIGPAVALNALQELQPPSPVTAGSAGIAGCGRRTQGNGLNDQSEDWPGMARTASAGTLGTAHRSRRGNKAGLRNPSRISFACVAAWGSSAGNHCKLARSRSALESSLARMGTPQQLRERPRIGLAWRSAQIASTEQGTKCTN